MAPNTADCLLSVISVVGGRKAFPGTELSKSSPESNPWHSADLFLRIEIFGFRTTHQSEQRRVLKDSV